MFNDFVSGFAREYVQNSQWLPKAARSVCTAIFAVGALVFPEPIVAGVVSATDEMTAKWMETMQPTISNISDSRTQTRSLEEER